MKLLLNASLATLTGVALVLTTVSNASAQVSGGSGATESTPSDPVAEAINEEVTQNTGTGTGTVVNPIPPAEEEEVVTPPAEEEEVVTPPAEEEEVVTPPAEEEEVVIPPAEEEEVVTPPVPTTPGSNSTSVPEPSTVLALGALTMAAVIKRRLNR